jgi:hypothetical protein
MVLVWRRVRIPPPYPAGRKRRRKGNPVPRGITGPPYHVGTYIQAPRPPGWGLDAGLTTWLCKKKMLLENPKRGKPNGIWHNLLWKAMAQEGAVLPMMICPWNDDESVSGRYAQRHANPAAIAYHPTVGQGMCARGLPQFSAARKQYRAFPRNLCPHDITRCGTKSDKFQRLPSRSTNVFIFLLHYLT